MTCPASNQRRNFLVPARTRRTLASIPSTENVGNALLVAKNWGQGPGSVKALQTAVVQAVALYGIELQGIRRKPEPRVKTTIEQVQRIVNAQARATLGCFPSTPVGILMAESGMTPATAMAKGRAHRFLVNAATKPGKGTLNLLFTRYTRRVYIQRGM